MQRPPSRSHLLITRVFMLFRGLDDEVASHDQWQCAQANSKKAVGHWKSVVGCNEVLQKDGIFKVLEWGGMEVQ